MPRARPVASGSDVIRMDKPKKKGGCGCGSSCSCSSCKKPGRLSRTPSSSSSKMDRNDALTPTEYLAACDLGIQDRSRPYIRARLDAAAQLEGDVREDMPSGRGGKKCGNSTIPANKQCRNGVASTVGKVAAGAGAVALGAAAYKNRGAIKSAAKSTALKGATAAGSAYGKAKRTVGAVRAAGPKRTALAVAASAGRNTARAQNAVGKVAANMQKSRAVRTGRVGAKRALRRVSSMIGR